MNQLQTYISYKFGFYPNTRINLNAEIGNDLIFHWGKDLTLIENPFMNFSCNYYISERLSLNARLSLFYDLFIGYDADPFSQRYRGGAFLHTLNASLNYQIF